MLCGCWRSENWEGQSSDACSQVYLQEYAWTEAQKAGAVAQRAEHAAHPAERALLIQEPMFCFQTAVALHRWSCLTYMGTSLAVSVQCACRQQSCNVPWRHAAEAQALLLCKTQACSGTACALAVSFGPPQQQHLKVTAFQASLPARQSWGPWGVMQGRTA